MQVILYWVLSFKHYTCMHTCAPSAYGPLRGSGHVQHGHTEEILPSQFPGTELGVTWLADAQPRWKECNSTLPPSPISLSAPIHPAVWAQLCEDRQRNIQYCRVRRTAFIPPASWEALLPFFFFFMNFNPRGPRDTLEQQHSRSTCCHVKKNTHILTQESQKKHHDD